MKSTYSALLAVLCLQFFAPAYGRHSTKDIAITINSIADVPPVEGMNAFRTLNEKAHRTFIRTYGSADSIRAYTHGDKTFVTCTVSGTQMRISYDLKGREVYTIKYLMPDRLPIDVAELVKTEFRKYEVLRASEVTTHKGTAHLVDIRYKNKCKTIRISENRFDVYKEFEYQD